VNVEAFSTSRKMNIFIEFIKKHNTFLIVDEATRIKNPQANRTINIIYNLAHCKKQGRKVIDVIPYSKYRAVLTGMMITNSPYDLWAMFEFLKHNYFGMNFYAFKARYGIEVRDTAPGTGQVFNRKIRPDEIETIHKYHAKGKHVETIAAIMSTSESSVQYIIDHPNIRAPYKRLDELKERIQPLAYIVRKEDCFDLPPKVYEKVYVYMNADQKRVYKELKEQFITSYEEKDLTVQNKLTLVGRLQQITGGFFPYEEDGEGKIVPITNKNPKIEALKKDLNETGDEAIIIWAKFVGELKMIHSELCKSFPEKNIELYYGGVGTTRRQMILNAFKEGEVNILIANAATAGTGLNLQKAHMAYYYSNSYSLEERAQSEDRLHRSGQTHSVLYKDIIMVDTVDEAVFSVLQTKKNLLDYFRSKSLSEFLG
jgi:SNF2 family DNA or RNA helicase